MGVAEGVGVVVIPAVCILPTGVRGQRSGVRREHTHGTPTTGPYRTREQLPESVGAFPLQYYRSTTGSLSAQGGSVSL